MAEDTIFCGVFDGHGPYGHLVSRKVRDVLPVKLQTILHSISSKQTESGVSCFTSISKRMNDSIDDPAEEGSTEEKLNSLWREAFLKSYKAVDKELKSHPNLDSFCSGSTAVTLVKQVLTDGQLFGFSLILFLLNTVLTHLLGGFSEIRDQISSWDTSGILGQSWDRKALMIQWWQYSCQWI